MSYRQSAGLIRLGHIPPPPRRTFAYQRRLFSSKPPPNPDPQTSTSHSRIDRIINRLPRFLHRYAIPIRNAPLSHITAFAVLHEITAVVPLVLLVGVFHYTRWTPSYFSEGKWVSQGKEKFGNYFRKKGWIRSETAEQPPKKEGRLRRWWRRGGDGVRLLTETATAWAIVKALLPARLLVSVWATPWFARLVVVPTGRFMKGLF